MAGDPKHLVRTRQLAADAAAHIRHPLNPNSEVFIHRVSDSVGIKRAHLQLTRVPPGRESFIPHAHASQEEWVFILDGEGLAQIGDARVEVGPGDYMGFPVDGTIHHLTNTGARDLVYLMGGERTELEVARFPTVGKVAVFTRDGAQFFDEHGAHGLAYSAWLADKK
ncbi:MAG: cupin domain-containing protein [Proteobacteria bacterium]|nr:cupin domain-containing protein [Pseudomonadota bacterium]